MTTIHGIYRSDRIDLKERLNLPEGTNVRLQGECESAEGQGDIMDLFGSLDDPTFVSVVEEVAW